MTKEEQEQYIKENIGYILQEYRTKSGMNMNPVAILHENKALIVKNVSEIGLRSKIKTRTKDAIRKGQVPVFYYNGEEFTQLWILNKDEA